MESGQRLLVISPHLDDAVLSCGLLIAAHPRTVVCTVFTAPPAENMTTDWDRAAGFADAFEAMRARQAEDREALGLLSAIPVHLLFRDAQYHASPDADELITALNHAVSETKPTLIVMPLGLFHSDHVLVSNACLALMRRQPATQFVAYEDVPYRRMSGVVQARLCDLAKRGYAAQPPHAFDAPGTMQHERMKRAAIDAYRSQLRAFGPEGQANLFSPERCWQLGCDESAPTTQNA
ncbi:PIG-L deacetylase family protein [Paraburkholderia tuberum]|uniref:N-acetylglucosaminyl deacetylase, LmbE family n=1 Tax=Paraburkholderia tuberum TaxID=157910 RepID=A0A1H1KF81_9BURK|nr:PIG-L family deacetylase [Paraburkholderia tuberum]SDR60479.1 N-acetylglucosaminyl deacetylase, LmbE family [Paraburkholderia tuberum]